MRLVPLLLLACARPPAAPVQAPPPNWAELPLMGTVFRVGVPRDAEPPWEAMRGALARAQQLERELSEWQQGSELSAVSRAAGAGPVPVSDDVLAALVAAREIAERSDGAFDPTWAALWPLWRFDEGSVPPEPEAVDAARGRVDWTALQLDTEGRTARLDRPGMALGLGGIAKGFALDEMAKRPDLPEVLWLEAGGQWLVRGTTVRVGVRDPDGGRLDVLGEIAVRDASIATSGDYERSFEHDGKRYHHLLDPRTGWPADRCRAATVVAPTATAADGWSTACFVAGADACLAWAARYGFEALVVAPDGAIRTTSGLEFVSSPANRK